MTKCCRCGAEWVPVNVRPGRPLGDSIRCRACGRACVWEDGLTLDQILAAHPELARPVIAPAARPRGLGKAEARAVLKSAELLKAAGLLPVEILEGALRRRSGRGRGRPRLSRDVKRQASIELMTLFKLDSVLKRSNTAIPRIATDESSIASAIRRLPAHEQPVFGAKVIAPILAKYRTRSRGGPSLRDLAAMWLSGATSVEQAQAAVDRWKKADRPSRGK